MEKSARQYWIDYAKCVAILAVVLGHTYSFGNPVHAFVYSFHIPLFFVISGYLTKAEKPKIKKLANRLLLPYVLICLLTFLLLAVKGGLSRVQFARLALACIWASGGDVPNADIPGIGLAWFLMASFIAKIMFQMIQVNLDERGIGLAGAGLVYGIVMFAGWELGKSIFLPFAFNQAMVAVLYIYVGYCLRSVIGALEERSIPILLVTSLIWAICLWSGCFYSIGNLFHVGRLAVGVVMSLSSSLTMVLLMRKLEKVIGGGCEVPAVLGAEFLARALHPLGGVFSNRLACCFSTYCWNLGGACCWLFPPCARCSSFGAGPFITPFASSLSSEGVY